MAQAIAGAFKAVGIGAPAAAPVEPEKSAYEQLISKFQTGSDEDKATLDLHKEIHGAMEADILKRVRAEQSELSVKQFVAANSREALNYVQDQLLSLYEGDDAQAFAVKSLSKEIAEEVQSLDAHEDLRNRIARGEGWKAGVKALVEKHSKEFDKITKRSERATKGGIAGMSGGNSSGQNTAPSGENKGSGKTVNDLTTPQREWYYPVREQCLSVGMSEDEAHKTALERALKVPSRQSA